MKSTLPIICAFTAGVLPTGAATLITTQNSYDLIVGVRQGTALALGYTPGAPAAVAQNVGTGGGGGNRFHVNRVVGFLLPTLPAGETLSGANFSFTATGVRDHQNDNDVELDFYVLDTTNPDTSGTTFFRQDNSPGASEIPVGSFFSNLSSGSQVTIPSPDGDVSEDLAGGSLAYLQGLYDPAGNPTQAEVFFRFNVDSNRSLTDLDRYQVDFGTTEFTLTTTPVPEPSAALLGGLGCLGLLLRRRR